MIFSKWFLNRNIDHTCLEQVLREQNDVRIVDLERPKMLGPSHDRREYVARMGLFTEDMMYVNIPILVWYVRRNGSIWAEWQVRAPKDTPLYNTHVKKVGGSILDEFIIYPCPMSIRSRGYINDMTREHWVMHKLSSDTAL